MNIGVMTPHHPNWGEFIDERLQGPDGCNFRKKDERKGSTIDNFTWTCDNTLNRPITRRILAAMGCSPVEIEQSLGFFMGHGGMCDCEVVFNVQNSVRPRQVKRRRR